MAITYTEEDYARLEQEERELTDEAIAASLLVLSNARKALEKELRDFYQRYGKDGILTYAEARKWISEQDRRRRLTALTLFLGETFASSLDKLKVEFEKMLKSVVGKETGFFDVNADWELILNTPWGADNLTWLKRLEADVDLWTVRISTDWKRSLLQRKHIDEVLKLLDERFTTIESVVNTLGLTESTAVGSIARQKIFTELGITKYKFYTKPDERRCETCGSMHGLVFPISAYEVGVTASPMHPRCRCWEVPITE